jgi:glycosyltransferase involved in cell wall biosynthesis
VPDGARPGERAIALVLDSGGPGGAERMLYQSAVELSRRGWRVVPVIPPDGEGWLRGLLEAHEFRPESISVRSTLDPRCLLQLVRVLRRHRVSAVHSHEFSMAVYGAAAARLLGVPHVITLHGGTYFAERRRRRIVLRWAARRSRALVAVSRAHAAIVERALGLAQGAVTVVPNGVEPPIPAGTDPRGELGLSPDTLLLVAVGNLYPVKGYDVLLRALAMLAGRGDLPAWHLAVAGRGGEEPALKALARDLNLEDRVTFLGLRADGPDLLQAADVFVMPSRSESHPLGLLEAMFAGRCVVASAVGGIPDTVTPDHDGLLVPPEDPAALADALGQVLAQPEARAAMGRHAATTATDRFTVGRMVDSYERLYTARRDPSA